MHQIPREDGAPLGGQHVAVTRRSLVLHLTARDDSLHRVITDLARKHVMIEELHFETGTDTHRVRLLVRAESARLDHVTVVLDNNVAVIDIVSGLPDAEMTIP